MTDIETRKLQHMGFSVEQIHSIPPETLKSEVIDYNNPLLKPILIKIENNGTFFNITSINLSREELKLGQICKVIKLLMEHPETKSTLLSLILGDNQLTELPATGELSALKTLDLSGSPLSALPESIGRSQSFKKPYYRCELMHFCRVVCILFEAIL